MVFAPVRVNGLVGYALSKASSGPGDAVDRNELIRPSGSHRPVRLVMEAVLGALLQKDFVKHLDQLRKLIGRPQKSS
jgi:hypothetical protein